MKVTAEDIEFIKIQPCKEHKKIERHLKIVFYLLVFDIMIAIFQGELPVILINLLIRIVSVTEIYDVIGYH